MAMEALASSSTLFFSPDHASAPLRPSPSPHAFSLRTASPLSSPFLSSLSPLRRKIPVLRLLASHPLPVTASVLGENPDWSDDDYLVVGLAHCFRKDESGKIKDAFLVEPVPAGGLECMENGGVTCYRHVTASTLGVLLRQDVSLLPPEFSMASFCEEFDFRAKCASRTWKRPHAVENLMSLVPKDGVRSDFNFSVEDKRVLNQEHVVKDSDNIKQDMSIDVYGRSTEEDKSEAEAQIASLYNV